MIAPDTLSSTSPMRIGATMGSIILAGILTLAVSHSLVTAQETSAQDVGARDEQAGAGTGGDVLASNLPTEADPVLREELTRSRRYPWFDAGTGRARSVELLPTPQPDGPVIWEWWDRWFGWNRNNSGTSRWSWNWGSGFARLLEWMVWILLFALVVYFLYLWWMRVDVARRLGLGSGSAAGDDDDGLDQVRIENLPVSLAATKADLLTQVRQLLGAGQLETAMIYLFSYQLVTLDKAQRLRLEKGKTNRQYLRELSGSSELRAIVAESTRAFEDVFFGRHSMSRDRFERIWERLERFQELARPAQSVSVEGEAA